MTLRLILIRHAKSSWDAPELGDHARPLNPRGRRAAGAIAQWLTARGETPDLVLSSDAARTRETWAVMAPHFDPAPRVDWRADLYHAGPGTMLQALRQAGDARTVLMLGHNPGIAQFAAAMVTAPPRHDGFEAYPTCATLIADFDADRWDGISPATGRVVGFIVPRDL